MNRLRRWSVVPILATLAVSAFGQTPAEEKWLIDRALTVTPAAAPAESLRYRLFPMVPERKDGNAVPIYLRLIHEQNDEARRHWTETPQAWNALPIDQVPAKDAREFVNRYRHFYEQFDYGARRRTADWGYTLEQPDAIGILMPDAARMRGYVPMQVLRARVRLAEGDYDAAARAFETGLSFSRQVGEGPFLISGLVGVAGATLFLDRLPEWVERPGSPNLYWSLTALPSPLIDLRAAMELEQRFMEMQLPGLRDIDRPRSPAEWDATLKQFRAEVKRLVPFLKNEKPKDEPEVTVTDPDEPAANSPLLPAARKFLAGNAAIDAKSAPDAQALMVYVYAKLREYRDEMFRGTYLPYQRGRAETAKALERLTAAPANEPVTISRLFLPAIPRVGGAQNRLERMVALLRVVEALRMHAAANGGKLPAMLAEVNVVPVPDDPGTGRPFEYRLDGDTATVSSRIPDKLLKATGIRFRVTVRK